MDTIKVLVICIHNSARSQMAEAFINAYGAGLFKAESAGLEPGTLNPLAAKVMQEKNIDISKNQTNSVFDFFKEGRQYTYVITVCDAGNSERCPVFPGITKQLHWPFEDPSSLSGSESDTLAQIRSIRDQIEEKVKSWINAIKNNRAQDTNIDFNIVS